MARGIALTDADREPWLTALHDAIVQWLADGKSVVLACSALKRSYREKLGIGRKVRLIYLKGSYDLIAARLQERHGHFATEAILADQFAALEEPDEAIVMSVQASPHQIVSEIRRRLGLE
jgi:gluconokinase